MRYTYVGIAGLLIVIAFIFSFKGALSDTKGVEWDNIPLEERNSYINELIGNQKALYSEAEQAMENAEKRASILREIRDEQLQEHGLQVTPQASYGVPVVHAGELKKPTHAEYLSSMMFTQEQIQYVLEHRKNVVNPDHFVAWLGAIARHEQGGTFVDGQTNYLAGRLKTEMRYKPFKTQLDGWVEAYNKYWYKNSTVSMRLNGSRYCVSDYHGGVGKGCPNRQKNVSFYLSKFGKIEQSVLVKKETGYYLKAVVKQNEANKLWSKCKEVGECKL